MFPFGESKKKLRQEIADLKQKNEELYKLQFRVGDRVYVNDGRKDPRTPYYLISSYNNGHCYYASSDKDSKAKFIGDEVHIKYLSHEPPKVCMCCKNLINQEKE